MSISIQPTLDEGLWRSPKTTVPQQVLEAITATVKQTFGDNVTVQFELSQEIAPLPSGKHSYAVSEVR